MACGVQIRDGKMRGIRKDGHLFHLTKELLRSAEENTGEIDSDDDSGVFVAVCVVCWFELGGCCGR
jgi:hypothetical protein